MTEAPDFIDNIPEPTTYIPHHREAEEAVIGSIIINPESYYDVAEFLRSDDFHIQRNRWVWEAIIKLHETRSPIDLITLTETLETMGRLEDVGGLAYLTELVNNVPSSLHIESYGKLVEKASIYRKMLEAVQGIAKNVLSGKEDVDDLLDKAEKAIFGVSERRITRDLRTIRQVLSDYYDQVDDLARKGEAFYGVPTGFIDLDNVLKGMQKSDFLIIAGRPASGKTAFLISTAKNASQDHKKNVAIFSLEMSNEQIAQRMLSQETGINSQRLRSAELKDDEWDLFTHAIEVLSNTRIFLDDTPGLTPLQLRAKCRRLHLEYNLDLIIVDYLQLMAGERRAENRVQEVSYISRSMKILAKELNVPVLAAAQLSRAVEHRSDKEPQLSDLRESGSLEQDADVVMFIHRPPSYADDPAMQNITHIKVAKHRNGPTKTIDLVFREDIAKFENAATRLTRI